MNCHTCGEPITDDNLEVECDHCDRAGCEQCMPLGLCEACENAEVQEPDDEA